MNTRIKLVGIGLSLYALCCPVLAADTIESVEKTINDKWSAVKSLSAKMTTDMNVPGRTTKITGTIEFLAKDGKEMFRSDMSIEASMGPQQMKASVTSIMDGEFTYTVQDMMGMKQAVKADADTFEGSPGGKKMFETWRKDGEIKLLPDEKIDGKDHYVIEAKPKEANPMMSAFKFYFGKDSGLMAKMVGVDGQGKEVLVITYSDVKLNTEIAADRFVFKAPDGVTVTDMTKPAVAPVTPAPVKPAGH